MNAKKHADCYVWAGENCGADDCPAAQSQRRREKAVVHGAWSELVLRREPSGWRHFVDGKPVHCGEALELQHLGSASDDYGEYSTNLPTGTIVRYEARLAGCPRAEDVYVHLHLYVGDHEFVTEHSPRMRFRWPARSR